MGAEIFLPVVREALQIPGLLKEIYTDLAKPGVTQVGKALGTVLGLGNTILMPLYLLNERVKAIVENNLEKFRASLEDVPEPEIVPVRPELGVPILEKLTYVSDDELSDLYVNLLSKASTVHTAGFAHPSFVYIINNLSPDEAVLLKLLRNQSSLPFVSTTLQNKSYPFDFRLIKDLCTTLEDKVQFSFGDNLEAYFSNLSGHGILDIRRDIHLADSARYEELETDYRAQAEATEWYKTIPEGRKLAFRRGKIEVTPFGRLFIDACVKKLGNE